MPENKVQLNPELTAVAITYRNKKCISDEIFPIVPVATRSFEYSSCNKKNNLTVPETRIGDTGEPNRVNFKGEKETATVEEHSLEEVISVVAQEEAAKSANKIDLKSKAALQLSDLMQIRREINIAQTLSKKELYKSNFKELSANEKIDKDGVDSFKLVREAIKSMLFSPNLMILSRRAFYALTENPYIVSAANKNDARAGSVNVEDLKRIFEIEKILIGESVHNTSKKNDIPNFVQCWNDDIILAYQDLDMISDEGASFGFRAEYEKLQIFEYFDGKPGMKGSNIIKAYMSYIDLITCSECGFLISNVLTKKS